MREEGGWSRGWREGEGGSSRVAVLAVQPQRVLMYVPGAGVRPFHYQRVLDEHAGQAEAYAAAARGAVYDALNGLNACLLCYGQTGSGKTYTLFGPDGALESALRAADGGWELGGGAGVAPRALRELLSAAAEMELASGVRTSVSMQYVQLYQDRITDLLTGDPVALRAAGSSFLLHGAAEVPLADLSEAFALLRSGERRKRYASTAMNVRSSRAHTVLTLLVTQSAPGGLMLRSQLCLVDLAGSEQIKQSRAEGARKAEAVGINLGLLTLGKCITALVERRPHVPFYDSRLTMMLKSAFGEAPAPGRPPRRRRRPRRRPSAPPDAVFGRARAPRVHTQAATARPPRS